ncbi:MULTISPECIES: group I truncated hemoglobin [unclassified Frankia]
MTTFYEILGREASIAGVVATFYDRILTDPELAPYFANTDLARLRTHQVAFLVAVTGGPKAYEGRDLAAAHAGLAVTDAAFDRIAGHLIAALTDAGLGAGTVAAVTSALLPLRRSIVTA